MGVFIKFFEIIIGVLVIMFACIFAIVGIGVIITKKSINIKSFKGEKKDE